jgi:hypothetical protein
MNTPSLADLEKLESPKIDEIIALLKEIRDLLKPKPLGLPKK